MEGDSELWGSIPRADKSLLSPSEKDALIRIPRPLPLDGPRIHQPNPAPSGEIRLRSDSCQDPYVHNGIKLLAHMRKTEGPGGNHRSLLGDLSSLKTQTEPFILDREKTEFARGKYSDSAAHKYKLTPKSTRQMLHKSVATICAFVGFEAAALGSLDLLTDVVADYLRTFTKLLRNARDRECLYERSTGFPDALERVCFDMNVGSVLQIQKYYEENVIKYYKNILKEWKKRKTASSSSSSSTTTTILVGSNSAEIRLGEDDIPEIHFPSSEEGSSDHATPQYETGLQVLQSLEQAGVMIPMEDQVDSIASPGINRKRRRTEDSAKPPL